MAKKSVIHGGHKAIHAHFIDAMLDIAEQQNFSDPDPNALRNGIKPGQWDGAPWNNMPPGSPITVLGKKGQTVYVISATGDLHDVDRWDLPTLMQLFAPYPNFALWAWPAFGKAETDPETGEPTPPKVKRLERDKAITCIISEAGRRGIFDPQENVRGRGGWRAQDQFVWHSGAHLWTVKTKVDGKTNKATGWTLQHAKPSEFDGYFYKKDREILRPWQEHVGVYDSPAHQLLEDLKTWNWERPYLDPILLLGWIASALMGGALEVRPIVFTTGGAGVGKSTLHGIIRAIYGDTLYSTANTTAAGIYQNIGQDSRPVAVDEFEAKANSSKEQTIIELARQAYSGAKLYRGGSNHEGIEFELRSSFMFSAINPPPLGVQDKTRMAILNLRKLDKGHGRQPTISDVAGRMILRQIMDGYHDYYWHILPNWKRILNQVGFDARAIDTYGTLLACAELLVGREGMSSTGFDANDEEWVIDAIRTATAAEISEQMEKWQDVMHRLLSSPIDHWTGGERLTVGSVLESYEANSLQLEEARARLAHVGLGLRPSGQPGTGPCLAIPHSDAMLDKIFKDSDYYAGGWVNVLKQAPEAVVLRNLDKRYKNIKINRLAKNCLLVDLKAYDAYSVPEGMEA